MSRLKKMMKLRNRELKQQDIRMNQFCYKWQDQEKRNKELEKENAELKEQLWGAKPSCNNCGHTDCGNYQMQKKREPCVRWISHKDQLIKAKGLIKGLLDIPDLVEDRTSEHTELIGEAEKFLKE